MQKQISISELARLAGMTRQALYAAIARGDLHVNTVKISQNSIDNAEAIRFLAVVDKKRKKAKLSKDDTFDTVKK